jgi:predicted nucleic-acid-binding protein
MVERSARLMAKAARGEVSLYISPLVLAEILWVLKSFYRYSMTAISHVIISLVSAHGIEVDHLELIVRTVELGRDRNVDFADAYLALQAAPRGEMICTLVPPSHTSSQPG